MSKKLSRVIAMLMSLVAIIFVIFALNHPELSFPWSNAITYVIYCVYIVIMLLLYIAPFKKNK